MVFPDDIYAPWLKKRLRNTVLTDCVLLWCSPSAVQEGSGTDESGFDPHVDSSQSV